MTLKYDKNTKLIGGFSIDIVDETDPVWSYMLRHNMLDENIDWVTEDVITDLLEKPKVKLPKYIADKIEYCKDAEGYGLFHAMDYCFGYKDSAEWLEYNQETFARAWLDGYEVEKDKLYTVAIKSTGQFLHLHKEGNFGFAYISAVFERKTTFTKKELIDAGFGGVFDNEMFEVEEVE